MALAQMKKVFLVGPVDRKEETVQFLQEMGVVHVEPAAKVSGEVEKKNAALLQEVRRVRQVCDGVTAFEKETDKVPVQVPDEDLVPFCESKLSELQEVQSRKQSLQKLVLELRPWGNFSPDKLRDLEKEGVFVQRFRLEGKVPSDFTVPDDVFMEGVSEKPVPCFYTVRIGSPVEMPQAAPLRLPEMGLNQAQDELERLRRQEKILVQTLAGASDRMDVLRKQYLARLNEASFREQVGTLYSEDPLFGLQGWIPADLEETLFKEIETSGFPLLVRTREPMEEETPPTLFKNNWFIRRIEPLLQLYGLPAYGSIDPSYFFAPFMILFFGICLGDAGYGLVFLLASTWIKKRWGHRAKGLPLAMKLCQAFSVSAILIGVITGSVFGYTFANREWILVDLDLDVGDPMILFYASLGLGVIHLSLSYLLGMLQASSSYERLQRFGLMMVLWGGALLISRSIWFSDPSSAMSLPLNYSGIGFLGLGVLLTFLFASGSKKWAVRIGLGFWSVYGLTGLIGDLLSYARLFGLGIATTAIAAVMNQLAGMVYQAAGPVVGAVLGILLLIMGHTFNLALSVLGSTVHSARLHFVEAFKSFFQGGGVEYKPFKVERG